MSNVLNGSNDNLYKNLDHISKAYLATESVILAWEAIFALVVGQLFIAYTELCDTQRNEFFGSLIVLVGFILSMFWFALFVKSQHYQRDRVNKMKKLENCIKINDSTFLGYTTTENDIGKIHAWHVTQVIPIIFACIWLVLWIFYPSRQCLAFFIIWSIIIIFAVWGLRLFVSLYEKEANSKGPPPDSP